MGHGRNVGFGSSSRPHLVGSETLPRVGPVADTPSKSPLGKVSGRAKPRRKVLRWAPTWTTAAL